MKDAEIKVKQKDMSSAFLRISVLTKSTKLVFSDEPKDRTSGGWKDWGFVDTSERLDVVYVQKAFLKAAGNSGTLWKCVLTLIHELSHRVEDTEDYRYDDGASGDLAGRGLKPGGTFKFEHATDNADSWAVTVTGSATDVLFAWEMSPCVCAM